MTPTPAALPVHCPLAGDWVAVNTPAERVPSHGTHFLGQTYAFDFARLTDGGQSFSRQPLWRQFLWRVPARDFLAWGQPVCSAFSGRVVEASDDWPDRLQVNSLWEVLRAHVLQRRPREDDLRPLLGNHVLVQGESGVALYAHLQRHSAAVRTGDRVTCGQLIGAVGNSGNSTMPHLHFQVTDRADLWRAQGLPCGFVDVAQGDWMAPGQPLVPALMKVFHAGLPVSRPARLAGGSC